MVLTQIFNLDVPCCQQTAACVCGKEERVLRYYAYGPDDALPAMTDAQREWCINEADQASEGAWSRADLSKLTDRQLADAVLMAWKDYAVSQGLY